MIKCIYYLKSLKQLFIIGLISFFIFGLSYSEASSSILYYGTLHDSPLNNQFKFQVNKNGNLLTQFVGMGKRILQVENGIYFFWGNNNTPYMSVTNIPGDGGIKAQGFVNNYAVCDYIGLGTGKSGPENCIIYPITSLSSSLGRFLQNLSGYYYIYYNSANAPHISSNCAEFMVCFSNSNYNNSMCFWVTNGNFSHYCNDSVYHSFVYDQYNSNVSDSMDVSPYFDFISNAILGNSPGQVGGASSSIYTGSNLTGSLGVQKDYTNGQILSGYEGIGLFSDLCYGGFDIDNIFDPSESFEDFTGYKVGYGATIFDLYSLYSGFSSVDKFLQTILVRYQNGQINQFKTEPKALLMVGSQLNVAGVKTSYVAEYCDLLLNSDRSGIYTGDSAGSKAAKNYLENNERKNDLDNIVLQTSNVGIFNGENVDYTPATFFSKIMNLMDTTLKSPTKGGAVGILPGYIVTVLLGFVFIRLISH